MLWSLLAGQPLIIVGVTGPVSILSISIYTLTKAWDIPFIPFFAWAQIWAALMHIIMAMSNACDMLSWITRFSCEIFGVLIAVIYLYTGITDSVHAFTTKDATFEAGLWQLFVTLGMLRLALVLFNARQWLVFSSRIREIISDYGASIALIFWTGVVYFPRANLINIKNVETPNEFGTSNGRAWIADLSDLPIWAIFAAIIPGIIITILFFFDHNVSSIMAQASEFKLNKPSAFHWDYFVLGLIMFVTGILGIPPVNGLIPQAPLHVSSLLLTKYTTTEDAAGNTIRTHSIVGCLEQRYSNFFQAFFTGLMCFQPFLGLIALIPTAALSGLFLFMGIASFSGMCIVVEYVYCILLRVCTLVLYIYKLI